MSTSLGGKLLSGSRLFAETREASDFFEAGSTGYSASRPQRFDGLGLRTAAWAVEPTSVTRASSSFFDDGALFPRGTAELDCALLMRKVPVRWEPLESLTGEMEPAG